MSPKDFELGRASQLPLVTPAPGSYIASMNAPLIDPFARAISYLRVSVTDRCDFRCAYCMTEHMTFLPRPNC